MTTDTTDRPRLGASGLSQADWLDRLARIGRDHGFFERLGPEHLALFVQEGNTLVVSFDRAARVHAEEPDGLPPGFEAVRKREWSLLSILALGDPWFRSADLVAFFDRLAADGFFDSFAEVVFLGFGPASGHAACAYSSAAPGASVLAAAPAATLDPELAGFDRRFLRDRRRDFSRYGDAARLIARASQAVILYDPTEPVTAAHAAQFRADAVQLVPLRFTGRAPHRLIASGRLLTPLLRALARKRLTRARAAAMIRPVRRADPDYLWHLAGLAQAHGQFDRARRVAEYAADITGEARFTELAERLDPGAGS
ncbi:phosphoadenosine phosphosulfate reductase [Roseicyclus persicicus]|uniref:Phosphoadenosine phosphosulfate reductase n=1 Tax=Roseicyclus persicicus TaxID=2650661 RepID=A0A7X6H0N1_9RHOB|nr:phosphoadenosine phosphosulfate reductase [Roseibacterium persicicum]NKX45861.1 phosphoadenosine phosphosulfate reductase [Roseibacterium persicicum]